MIELYTLLSDFGVIQEFNYLKRDMIKKLIQTINLKKSTNNTNNLDYNGFVEFILQLARILYNDYEKASFFLPKFFNFLKIQSVNSNQPLF